MLYSSFREVSESADTVAALQ